MHTATATAAGLLLLLAPLPGCGQGGALPAQTTPPTAAAADAAAPGWLAVGRGPSGVALADLDGDGDLDLAVANETGGDVAVLLGDGRGGFRPAPGSPFPAGANPTQLAVGDLDRDGRLDLAIANHATTYLSVLLGRSGGAFAPAPGSPVQVPSRPHPHTVAAADLDGDGDLDLATDSWEEDRLLLLANDGRGRFPGPAIPLSVGDHPYSNALATDVDGDGRADLVTPNLREGSVSVLLAGGEGRFAPAPGSPYAAGPSPFWVACGDVTGDRRPDLVVANYGGGLDDRSDDGLHVLPGQGTGRFGAAVRLPACWGPTRVELADLDGDGTLDAALACLGDHQVRFFRGGPSGLAPAPWPAVPVGGGPGGIALGDVDGDGRADLVASDGPGGRVRFLRSPAARR